MGHKTHHVQLQMPILAAMCQRSNALAVPEGVTANN
jgi:hypothetical protein